MVIRTFRRPAPLPVYPHVRRKISGSRRDVCQDQGLLLLSSLLEASEKHLIIEETSAVAPLIREAGRGMTGENEHQKIHFAVAGRGENSCVGNILYNAPEIEKSKLLKSYFQAVHEISAKSLIWT